MTKRLLSAPLTLSLLLLVAGAALSAAEIGALRYVRRQRTLIAQNDSFARRDAERTAELSRLIGELTDDLDVCRGLSVVPAADEGALRAALESCAQQSGAVCAVTSSSRSGEKVAFDVVLTSQPSEFFDFLKELTARKELFLIEKISLNAGEESYEAEMRLSAFLTRVKK